MSNGPTNMGSGGTGGGTTAAALRYALRGPQIEPAASYWMYCARLRLVNIEELSAVTDNPANQGVGGDSACYFPPYDPGEHPNGLQQLKALETHRDNPDALAPNFADPAFPFPPRLPISRLWNLMPPPVGAVLAERLQNEQQIRTGRGLARAVESETPGLVHRHILNYLVRLRPDWSPPRQALIWAGLDVTIASALQAAWYYKWLAEDPPKAYSAGSAWPIARPLTSFRPRPIEYAVATGTPFTVLFDNPDELNPNRTECPPPNDPLVLSVGTPRHPAYPSGHSTYAAAASEYLSFFFGELVTPPSILATQPAAGSPVNTTLQQEFDYLADNIGLGRMWAGIHWLTDHTNGARLGRVVARMVLKQLIEMLSQENLCMQPLLCPNPQPEPQDQSEVKDDATAFRDNCQPVDRPAEECLPQPSEDCPDVEPCPAPPFLVAFLTSTAAEARLIQASRSPQRGGGLSLRVNDRPAGAQPGAATQLGPSQDGGGDQSDDRG